MIEPSLIYWAEVMEGIKRVSFAFSIMCVIGFLVACMSTEDSDNPVNLAMRMLWIFIVTSLLALFIPSQQTIYMMAGANAINSADLGPEAAKVRKLINQKLDEALEVEDGK
jgi:FtsH-binding integral membrane protein